MLNRLPELLINGASLLLLGKEYFDHKTNDRYWQDAYNAERENSRQAREEVVVMHNNILALMQQIHNVEVEKKDLRRSYLNLMEQIEDMGLEVDADNNILSPAGEDEIEEDEDVDDMSEDEFDLLMKLLKSEPDTGVK